MTIDDQDGERVGPLLNLQESGLSERFPIGPDDLDDEIEEIDVSKNAISHLDIAIFEKYTPALRRLDVSDNLIVSLETVISLGTLPHLEDLDIRRNPCSKFNRVLLLVNLLFPWVAPTQGLREAGERKGLEEKQDAVLGSKKETEDLKLSKSTLRASCSAPTLVSGKGQADYQERSYRSCHSETTAPYACASSRVRQRFAELQRECERQAEEKSPATAAAPSSRPTTPSKAQQSGQVGETRFVSTPFFDRKPWQGLSDSILGIQPEDTDVAISRTPSTKKKSESAHGHASTVGRPVLGCLPRAHLFGGPLESPRWEEEISGLRFPRLIILNGSTVSVQQLEDVAVQAHEMLRTCKDIEAAKVEEFRHRGKDTSAEEVSGINTLKLTRLRGESYNEYCTRIHQGFRQGKKNRVSTTHRFYSKDFEHWTVRRNQSGGRPDSDEEHDYKCKAVAEFEHPPSLFQKQSSASKKIKAVTSVSSGRHRKKSVVDEHVLEMQREHGLWKQLRQHLYKIKHNVGRGRAESGFSSATDDWEEEREAQIEDLEFEMRATARERQRIKELRRTGAPPDVNEAIFDKCQQTLLESWNMKKERSLPKDEAAANALARRHFQDPNFEDIIKEDCPSLALKGDGPGRESKGRSQMGEHGSERELNIERGRTRLAKALCKSIHEDYSKEAQARRDAVLRSSRLWRLHEYADRLEVEEAMRPANKRQQLIDGIKTEDLEGLDEDAFNMLMEEIEVGKEAKAAAQDAKAADAGERRAQTLRQDVKDLVVDRARRECSSNNGAHSKVGGSWVLGVKLYSEFAATGTGRAGRSTFHHGGRIDRNLMPRCAPPASRAPEYVENSHTTHGGNMIENPDLTEVEKNFFKWPKLPQSLDDVPQQILNESEAFNMRVAGLGIGDRIRQELSAVDASLKRCEDADSRLAEQRRLEKLLKSNQRGRQDDPVSHAIKENIAFFDVDNQNSDKRAMDFIRRKFFDGMQAALAQREGRRGSATIEVDEPLIQSGIAVQSEHLKTWLERLDQYEKEEDARLAAEVEDVPMKTRKMTIASGMARRADEDEEDAPLNPMKSRKMTVVQPN